MKKEYFKKKLCICCDSKKLIKVIDLGRQPLANNLLINENNSYKEYPLNLNACLNCGHMQLGIFVNPDLLFKNYYYSSGTSHTLNKYFQWFARECLKLKKKKSKVLDIGCNDGSLLDKFSYYGFETTGVDPAKNISKIAKNKGHQIISNYWPLKNKLNKNIFDLIIAQNVFAHNFNPYIFLLGIKKSLKTDGFSIIQTSQANMLEKFQFDTIYHEHYSFFNLNSFNTLLKKCNLILNKVLITDIHGDSFVFCFSKNNKFLNCFNSKPFFLKQETLKKKFNILNFKLKIKKFKLKAIFLKNKLNNIIKKYRHNNYTIVFVGAAAKAIVVMNYTKISPDYVIDEATLKIGKFIPKINKKISSFDIISKLPDKVLFIISAWNFKTELIKKIKSKYKKNSSYLTYYPKFELFK
jgi:SAM-dependent methyltransferase